MFILTVMVKIIKLACTQTNLLSSERAVAFNSIVSDYDWPNMQAEFSEIPETPLELPLVPVLRYAAVSRFQIHWGEYE